MNLLAVETSSELCSVALLRGKELFVEEALAENRHSDMLAPMIRRVLERARLAARQMDAFAFGQGPGSFTGIRIACGVVQGLAFAADRPVVPVPSLLALAEQSNETRVIAALDARMNEAYVAAYARNGDDWDEVIAPRLADAEGLPALPGRRWTATGSGFDRHGWLRDTYRDSVEMRLEGDLPRAGSVARVAVRRFARGHAVPADQAAPLYLRDKVALTSAERKSRR
ncbi:MAG TPA: tRNA (adenosine(37)-N6)-threonylcarbamoyltransferase complex dimerization subunit type 1 TsaB [Usitatibacter sp.]|nr:tRNA (adenosine(37)-N6)-threonylcarbamoyltransferase complex dimerization subunit type 1 TsaB [Usitatibacter sp.]